MKCKVCGKDYHCCSACDTSSEEYLTEGYCSRECFIESKFYKQEKGQFLAFLDRLDEGAIRLFKVFLDNEHYLLEGEYEKWIDDYLNRRTK